MFSIDDKAYEVASRLVVATPEQLNTHAVAQALRLSEDAQTFTQNMQVQEKDTLLSFGGQNGN